MRAPRRAWLRLALAALFLLAGCGGETPAVVEPMTPAEAEPPTAAPADGVELPPTATATNRHGRARGSAADRHPGGHLDTDGHADAAPGAGGDSQRYGDSYA
ncbi:MAG: hypothetical protein P8129_11420 [Anaerolineae bacterium]